MYRPGSPCFLLSLLQFTHTHTHTHLLNDKLTRLHPAVSKQTGKGNAAVHMGACLQSSWNHPFHVDLPCPVVSGSCVPVFTLMPE